MERSDNRDRGATGNASELRWGAGMARRVTARSRMDMTGAAWTRTIASMTIRDFYSSLSSTRHAAAHI